MQQYHTVEHAVPGCPEMALCRPKGYKPRCLKQGIVGYLGLKYLCPSEILPSLKSHSRRLNNVSVIYLLRSYLVHCTVLCTWPVEVFVVLLS